MTKFKYSESEQKINRVLAHQDKSLKSIDFPSEEIDTIIYESESILNSLGYPSKPIHCEAETREKRIIIVPAWKELCEEAEKHVKDNYDLTSIFSDEELKNNSLFIQNLNAEFDMLHKLDKYDIAISALASIVGAMVDILLTGIPKKSPTGLKGGPLSNYIRDYFDKHFPENEMKKLANSKISKVPFDAQDNRNTKVHVEGLSAYYHRLLQLGHDPILGFIFGISDILNGTMTTIDKNGKIVSQVMKNYADRTESDVFSALAKEINHLKSDITTSMGLPAPLMSLFNLLQFGSIGEEEQTIAEIVQGMYYEGYDFVHFCSMSVSTMIIEVIIRLGYAIKRIKKDFSINDSIPFSINRNKNPKLATMLFLGHSGATAANAGKIYFSKNPLAINYPQWLAFGKYSYSQLKWALYEKPALRNIYVNGKINEELVQTLESLDKTMSRFDNDYIFIFN